MVLRLVSAALFSPSEVFVDDVTISAFSHILGYKISVLSDWLIDFFFIVS